MGSLSIFFFQFYLKIECRSTIYKGAWVVLDIKLLFIIRLNPCRAEWIKIPRPLLFFTQSDYLIRVVDTN